MSAFNTDKQNNMLKHAVMPFSICQKSVYSRVCHDFL